MIAEKLKSGEMKVADLDAPLLGLGDLSSYDLVGVGRPRRPRLESSCGAAWGETTGVSTVIKKASALSTARA